MKNLSFFTAVTWLLFLCITAFAENTSSALGWSLITSGMWEENKTLHNRLDFRLHFAGEAGAPSIFTLRGQTLDRRPLNFNLDSPWGDPEKAVTHYQGALYHNSTGSRLLYGVLDEWGLSARIRNPWIRSAPYTVNHMPLIADLKTAAASTKEDEVYLYLSTPFLNLSENIKARGFISAQTEINRLTPAFSGGIDLALPNKSNLLIETFYTWAELPPTKSSSWFSNPPPLPERDFNLYAAGILYSGKAFSVSSDFALSETFAWGTGFYVNLGLSVSLSLPKLFRGWNPGRIERPLTISLAFDAAEKRFVYRDGADHGEAFRASARMELKGARNALLRFSTTLRGPEISEFAGEGFRRSSTNIYWRLPAAANSSLFRLTRVSISIDRNADDHLKITDRLYGYAGFSLNLSGFGIKTPVLIYLNGSIRGITSANNLVIPYPVPRIFVSEESWIFEDCAFYSEFTFSPSVYQFKTRIGYSNNSKNRQIWDFSASGAVRFKQGRLSFKVTSPELPNMWNFTISWRLEAK